MTQEEQRVYIELQKKLYALTSSCQRMLAMRTPETEESVNIALLAAQLEISLVQATMISLHNNAPIPMPSDAMIDEMRHATAGLQQAVAYSAALGALMDATSAAIEAWPKA